MVSTRLLTLLGVVLGVFLPLVYYVEQNLESFLIFETDHLQDLAKRAVSTYGNDTKSMVAYIQSELHTKLPGHINLDEEWFFNNAGGAMGGMYILHASKSHRRSISTSSLR